MSSSDRLLVPACICGRELTLLTPTDPSLSQDNTHVRVYRCGDCSHETRIIVWGADICEARS